MMQSPKSIKLRPNPTDYATFVKTTADANNLPQDHPFRLKKGPCRVLLELGGLADADEYLTHEQWVEARYSDSWLKREYARQKRLNISTGQNFRFVFKKPIYHSTGLVTYPNDEVINLGRFEEKI